MRLNRRQRVEAHNIILRTTGQMLEHREAIHYTQEWQRWQGISQRRRVVHGQFPNEADCSSMATWILWNALTHALGTLHIPDVVNGENWGAGFTGTMIRHGHRPRNPGLVGDCYFYGPSVNNTKHVTVGIGGGWVFSHGSEPGPYKLHVLYRSDYLTCRRYILRP